MVETMRFKFPDIAFDDIPLRPVGPQRFTGLRIYFNQGQMLEAGLFQADGLAAAASTYFYGSEF